MKTTSNDLDQLIIKYYNEYQGRLVIRHGSSTGTDPNGAIVTRNKWPEDAPLELISFRTGSLYSLTTGIDTLSLEHNNIEFHTYNEEDIEIGEIQNSSTSMPVCRKTYLDMNLDAFYIAQANRTQSLVRHIIKEGKYVFIQTGLMDPLHPTKVILVTKRIC
jgi:hypothetical protein